MEKKKDLLGIFLAAVTGAAMLLAVLARTFLPRFILPNIDVISITALSLIALVLDFYIVKGSKRDYRLIPVYAFLIFGLFPFAACFTAPFEAVMLALLGTVIFTACTFLFDSMTDRLSTGPATRLAPLVSAFGLFLAVQCLMGIIK